MQTARNNEEEFKTDTNVADKYKNASSSSTEQPFKPLTSERPNEKSYSKPNIKINRPEDLNQPIPEPTFNPQPLNADGEGKQQSSGSSGGAPAGGNKSAPTPPINPQMGALDDKERENAAKQAAAMTINAYEGLHKLGNSALTISERKLQKMSRKGLIDMRVPVPIDSHRAIPLTKFVGEYNEQTGDMFKVSEKFKSDVTPVLERVYKKRGIGATDEQTLIYFFSKDLIVKGAQFIALFRQRNDMLSHLKDATDAYRSYAAANNTMPPQQPGGHSMPPQPEPAPYQAANASSAQPNYQQEREARDSMGNSRPAYTPPPTPPSFGDEEVIEPEIIPNDMVFEKSPLASMISDDMGEGGAQKAPIEIKQTEQQGAKKRGRRKNKI